MFCDMERSVVPLVRTRMGCRLPVPLRQSVALLTMSAGLFGARAVPAPGPHQSDFVGLWHAERIHPSPSEGSQLPGKYRLSGVTSIINWCSDHELSRTYLPLLSLRLRTFGLALRACAPRCKPCGTTWRTLKFLKPNATVSATTNSPATSTARQYV